MKSRLLLIILDGLPWRNWKPFMGNLEGWAQSGAARKWRMRSVLPSTSACCYASIHTGVSPQVHGIGSNEFRKRVAQPDIFSEVTRAGGRTGAVTHSYWSEFFNRHPFDPVRDIEYDEPDGPITHGRFHTMSGYNHAHQMTPRDVDLFATLPRTVERPPPFPQLLDQRPLGVFAVDAALQVNIPFACCRTQRQGRRGRNEKKQTEGKQRHALVGKQEWAAAISSRPGGGQWCGTLHAVRS